MTDASLWLSFTVQFAVFLVGASGLTLMVIRPRVVVVTRSSASVLGLGFASLAVLALLRGFGMEAKFSPTGEAALCLAASLFLLVGSIRWSAGRLERIAFDLGAVLIGLSFIPAGGPAETPALLLSAGGSILVGLAIALSSRSAIAARVEVGLAGALLVLVLVLAVSLSSVITGTVRQDATARLDSRASAEVDLISQRASSTGTAAKILGGLVYAFCLNESATSNCLSDQLPQLAAEAFGDYRVEWVDYPDQRVGATSKGFATPLAKSLAASNFVTRIMNGIRSGSSQLVYGVEVLDGRAYIVGAASSLAGGRQGAVVTSEPLDSALLGQLRQSESQVSLALVQGSRVIVSSGAHVPTAGLVGAAAPVFANGTSLNVVSSSSELYAAVPLSTPSSAQLALVASTSSQVVYSALESLLQTLFRISLGCTLLALLLAAWIGERIGLRIGSLTDAADSIRAGQVHVRARVVGHDEVGLLSEAFDAMASSIESKTRELEEAAAEEGALRQRLESVVNSVGDALVAVNGDGVITDFNPAAEHLIQTSAFLAVGKPVHEVVHLVGEDGREVVLADRLANLRGWTTRAWLLGYDNAHVPVEVAASPIFGTTDGDPGSVIVIRDLTGEMEVERMKSEFLSRVGHELRTPLTSIMGFTGLLARGVATPEQAASWRNEVLSQAKRLLRTIEMLEFFASSGAGRMRLRSDQVDINSLITEVVNRWSSGERRANITQSESAAGAEVLGDRRWLTLAIDELVDNAIKFSEPGSTTRVEVLTGSSEVAIEVIDQGKGMTRQEAQRVFGEFVQGDESDTRAYGGLGLGLALVKRVAESHGGTISCRSRPGRGTTMRLALPRAQAVSETLD